MYKRYDKYKDSGVEWIGEVPEHWLLIRLKNAVELVTRKSTKDDSNKPYIGLEHVQSWIGKLIYADDESNNDNGPSEELANTFKPGQVLFGKLRPYLAKGFLANIHGRCSSELLVLEPEKVIPSYLLYIVLTEGFIETVNSSTYGAKMPRASWSFIGNMDIPQPTYENQKAISNYLDHKTSEIDFLIADKDELIKKLEEYKQSIITEAVTKGLNPDVKMKDSGIEWIGEVPEHWEISKVKYHSNINQKTLTDKTPDDYEINYLDISNVDSNGKILNIEPMVFKDAPSRARRIVSEGDTLVSTVRTYLRAITWFDSVKTNLVCSTGFAVLNPKESVEPKYLSFLMKSTLYVEEIVSRSVGVSYPAITASEIADLDLLLPPISEQKVIVDYIDDIVKNLENIIADTNCQIQNLKKYRQSLIYEAATGKIDVREYEPERSEQLA